MSVSASTINKHQANSFTISTIFTSENFQVVVEKVKFVVKYFLCGLLFSASLISIPFLIAFGTTLGVEKGIQIFNGIIRN
jgi:hypothetical protein